MMKRCFIALDLPCDVIDEIKSIQGLIKKKNLFNGKFTEPGNLHLTLKFLGEIDEEKVNEVKNKLREIKFNDFEISLGNIGVFSSKYENYFRVVWIEILGKGVRDLRKQIDEKLAGLFEPEKRFMSHITIARIKKVYDRQGFLEYIKKIKVPKIGFKVDKFFLKKSELFETGPVYEDLEGYSAL